MSRRARSKSYATKAKSCFSRVSRRKFRLILVVFFVKLKKRLRMLTYGANLGGFGANNEVSAVTAFPNLYFALFENLSGFYVLQKRAISFLV